MSISNDGPAFMAAASAEPQQSTTSNGATSVCVSTIGEKLHGRAFYESIGSPKFVLAPMVDQSEFVRISLYLLFAKQSDINSRLGAC
jgi:tRNA-dihydrouridine synthase 1